MSIHEEIKNSSNLIYQDDDILIALDIDPISEGHVLILPQKKYIDLDELPFQVLVKIMTAAKTYVALLGETYNPAGFSMMQNGGDFNDIGVFHLHVFPRFHNDEFNWRSVYNGNREIHTLNFAKHIKNKLKDLSS